MTERPRPSCVRNLNAAFDAVAGDVPVEPPEISENRENLFAEQAFIDRTEEFKQRWGYDVRADRPVEGSDWEWEPINPPKDPGEAQAEVEVAVEEVAAAQPEVEPAEQNEDDRDEGVDA